MKKRSEENSTKKKKKKKKKKTSLDIDVKLADTIQGQGLGFDQDFHWINHEFLKKKKRRKEI